MIVNPLIVLAYFGVAMVLAMCLFAYYCSRYNKENPDVKFEVWMDGDKMVNLILGSIFFPIGLLMLIIALPLKAIMKLYKID